MVRSAPTTLDVSISLILMISMHIKKITAGACDFFEKIDFSEIARFGDLVVRILPILPLPLAGKFSLPNRQNRDVFEKNNCPRKWWLSPNSIFRRTIPISSLGMWEVVLSGISMTSKILARLCGPPFNFHDLDTAIAGSVHTG